MNNINCLVVEGNIVREPEFKTTNHGFPICKMPIAVNHYYKKGNSSEYIDEVSYFDVETFGKLAEVCAKYSQKGRGVSVVGRIKQNRWKSDEGKSMSHITIIAEKVEFKKRIDKVNDDMNSVTTSSEDIASQLAQESAGEQKESVTF